jgi:genome maintenance exonuclease 1
MNATDGINLNHYEARHVWRENRRYYATPTGETLPGVTTILSATDTEKGRLDAWRDRVGADEADRVSREACDRGKRLHTAIESYLKGAAIANLSDDVKPFFESIVPALNAIERPLLIEGTVWSHRGYAGTVDTLAVVGDELTVVDWKTASRPKRPEWIQNYLLQCAAYAGAVNSTYRDQGVSVSRAMVAIALADRPAQIFTLDPLTMANYWRLWLIRLERFQNLGSKTPKTLI